MFVAPISSCFRSCCQLASRLKVQGQRAIGYNGSRYVRAVAGLAHGVARLDEQFGVEHVGAQIADLTHRYVGPGYKPKLPRLSYIPLIYFLATPSKELEFVDESYPNR